MIVYVFAIYQCENADRAVYWNCCVAVDLPDPKPMWESLLFEIMRGPIFFRVLNVTQCTAALPNAPTLHSP
jgi:hypothetical protein